MHTCKYKEKRKLLEEGRVVKARIYIRSWEREVVSLSAVTFVKI